jgi:hypothetical protein
VTLERAGEEIVNVFHCAVAGGLNLDTATDIAEDFKKFWANDSLVLGLRGVNTILSSNVTLTKITVQNLNSVPYADPFEFTYAVVGALVGDDAPAQLTVNVQWKTATGGRNARGRTYLGGWMKAYLGEATGGAAIWIASQITDVNEACIDLRTRLSAAGTLSGLTRPLVVASLYDGTDAEGKAVPRAAGVTYPVTGHKIGNKPGTQRRRAAKIKSSIVVSG